MGRYSGYIVAFVILLVIMTFFISFLKRKKYLELIKLLETKKFDEFHLEVKKLYTKILFPPFNLDYMELNAFILENNSKEIQKSFDSFNKKNLNKKQKEIVFMMAFNYYINLEEYNKAKKYIDLINNLDNIQMKKEANRIYDIYALKGYKYLDEMLDEISMMDDTYKGVNEFLISLMYKNKNDVENSEKYRKLSEKHMKLLDRKISNNKEKEKKKTP